MGSYTHKLRKNEVVIKLHDRERDLAREVSILKKLGNNEHWIMYEYYHEVVPVEDRYLVLERHGVSLDSYLREIALSKDNKRSIVKELCHAVHALHQRGMHITMACPPSTQSPLSRHNARRLEAAEYLGTRAWRFSHQIV